MPCLYQPSLTDLQKQQQRDALKRLQAAIGAGRVSINVGKQGGVAFVGWSANDRSGVSDLCAYRALANTPEVRRALLRAEALSGNKMDPRALSSGLHSHDGGSTWSRH
jgi:hypothetical protein